MIAGDYGLTGNEFLHELHHLLWRKPFKNRGKRDSGLSCRDHAAIAGVVARRFGANVSQINGIMATITGESIPRNLIITNPHSWLAIDGKAPCDLSFRVTRREAEGSEWSAKCIWNSDALNDMALPVVVNGVEADFHRRIDQFGREGVSRAIIYRPITSRRFAGSDESIFADLDTPLRCEIKFATGQDTDVYLAMADFLARKIDGGSDSIIPLEQEAAWRYVLSIKQV